MDRTTSSSIAINFLHKTSLAGPLWKDSVFCTKICKSLQPLLLWCSKDESKMFVVITIKKFQTNCAVVNSNVCHDARDVGKIFVS